MTVLNTIALTLICSLGLGATTPNSAPPEATTAKERGETAMLVVAKMFDQMETVHARIANGFAKKPDREALLTALARGTDAGTFDRDRFFLNPTAVATYRLRYQQRLATIAAKPEAVRVQAALDEVGQVIKDFKHSIAFISDNMRAIESKAQHVADPQNRDDLKTVNWAYGVTLTTKEGMLIVAKSGLQDLQAIADLASTH